jgi:hypothetical protein
LVAIHTGSISLVLCDEGTRFFSKVTFTIQQYMQEMLTETKRQTAALEKLIAQYEERLTRIENKPDGTA